MMIAKTHSYKYRDLGTSVLASDKEKVVLNKGLELPES
jgi:hypothetical protein